MWLRVDVDESKEYRVALCQLENGKRYYKLFANGEQPPSESVFATEIVPTDLLFRRDFIGISEAVKLSNGLPFGVESHGIWLTKEECDALEADNDWSSVPWINGLPPHFLPK
jgi:hypothetical protein